MTTLRNVTIVTALLVAGTSLALAQNGPATGGEHPVAGGAAGGPYGSTHGPAVGSRTGICITTIGLTIGIGITRPIRPIAG